MKTHDEYIRELEWEYIQTGRLHSQLLTVSVLEDQYYKQKREGRDMSRWRDPVLDEKVCTEIRAEADVLEKAATRFFHAVWNNGLSEKVRNAKLKGLKGRSRGQELLIWACAGRVLFTIRGRKKDVWVSLICAEDQTTNVGIQGIGARPVDAMKMIHDVCDIWMKGKFRVRESGKVTIG